MSLLTLPTSLIAVIVCQFLEWKAISALDRACCNKKLRTLLMDAYRAKECMLQEFTPPINDQPLLFHWLLQREIRTEALQVTVEHADAAIIEYLERFGRSVSCAQSNYFAHNNFVLDLCRTCPNLKQLRCFGLESEVQLLFSKLEILHVSNAFFDNFDMDAPSLKQLSLCYVSTSSPFSANLITAKLVQLSVTMHTMFTDEVWVEICRRCPLLRSLQCFVFDDTLKEIVRLCPLIVNLCLDAASNYEYSEEIAQFSLSNVGLRFAVQHLQLRSLCVLHCGAWYNHLQPRLDTTCLDYITEYCANTLEVLYLDAYYVHEYRYQQLLINCTHLHTCHITQNIRTDWISTTFPSTSTTVTLSNCFTYVMLLGLPVIYVHLRVLNIVECELHTHLFDYYMIHFAEKCVDLRTIVLKDDQYLSVFEKILTVNPEIEILFGKCEKYDYRLLDMPV